MSQDPDSPNQLAEAIRHVADSAESEMDLQVKVEKLLDPFLPKIPGATLDRYGHATKLGGIKDALHGNLIIEYERPGKLAKRAGLDECLGQLRDYLTQEAQGHGKQASAALKRMVGVGLDGHQILFVRYRGRGAEPFIAPSKRRAQLTFFPDAEAQDFYVDGPHPVTTESVGQFLGYLHSLARLPLSPEALAETFGPKADIAHRVIGDLYHKLQKTNNRRVETFFAEWQRIFGIVYGQDIGKAEADARALGKQFGVKVAPKLKEFLFCVHTYFALLMKLLAAEVMTLQHGAMMQSFITPLVSANSEEFRKALRGLEDGGLFASQGISNFLEGDFFSWYLSLWDKSLADGLRAMLRALARFDPRTPYLAPEQSRDLLKKLYQYLVPKKLRHDLGEFYTPDWLAEHLLNQLEYNGDLERRLLDPACGSGTFLVLAIRRMKEWAVQHDPPIDPESVAKKILNNLCGFDLNPIAVIAARTNFLLAMGELVRYVRPIELPIYMCDSVLTPSEYAELFGKGYRIPTAAGEFEIPGEIVHSNQMEKLAGLLEQCARGDYSSREFLNRAKRELAITHQATFDALQHLYENIHKLEKQNRNGIWARWLKNAFAPLFKGKFEFVAGNPPWINWESLSDEYRKATRRLWEKYGLFSLKGHEARLGGGKKDFAMLFTYAAADNYLRDGDKLGFLITQTAFQTKGAGAGFRRFRIGSGTPLKVLSAEDLVSLKPFEGASNWTGLVVLKKGQDTTYPVEYVKWNRNKKAKLAPEMTLEDALSTYTRTKYIAKPISSGDPTSPWQVLSEKSTGPSVKITGKSDYKAKAGITTWLDGVFWLDVLEKRPDGLILVKNKPEMGKSNIGPAFTTSIEPDLLYPFVRWEDIHRYSWHAAHCILVTQDPTTKKGIEESKLKELPGTFDYLKRYERALRSRSGYRKYFEPKDAFYTVYNVSRASFSPIKVVWKTMGKQIEAAVFTETEMPGLSRKVPFHKNTVMFIPIDDLEEAHYLAALLNSVPVTFVAKSFAVSGGKGFGATNLLQHVSIPAFRANEAIHKELAGYSIKAHKLASQLASDPSDEKARSEMSETEAKIDRAAARLWGLTDSELNDIRKALDLSR
jgi:SAM-dependent methyltransferase